MRQFFVNLDRGIFDNFVSAINGILQMGFLHIVSNNGFFLIIILHRRSKKIVHDRHYKEEANLP